MVIRGHGYDCQDHDISWYVILHKTPTESMLKVHKFSILTKRNEYERTVTANNDINQ